MAGENLLTYILEPILELNSKEVPANPPLEGYEEKRNLFEIRWYRVNTP